MENENSPAKGTAFYLIPFLKNPKDSVMSVTLSGRKKSELLTVTPFHMNDN